MTRKQREPQEVVSPRVADRIASRLRELGWNGADFIAEMHRVYGAPKMVRGKKNSDEDSGGSRNHLYKILNGTATAGESEGYLLPKICKLLKLDFEEMLQLLRADKIEKKGWGAALPRADKTLKDIAAHWDTLSKADKAMIADLVHIKTRGASNRS